MHLADLTSFVQAQQNVERLYANPDAWASKAILNIAGSEPRATARSEYANGSGGEALSSADRSSKEDISPLAGRLRRRHVGRLTRLERSTPRGSLI
jgi:glucan phosphorylase